MNTRKELYNHDINARDNTAVASLWTGQPQELEPCILLSEVEAAIKKLKHRKSPGIDGICRELIQDGGEAASGAIFSICKRAWEEEEFPEIMGTVCDHNHPQKRRPDTMRELPHRKSHLACQQSDARDNSTQLKTICRSSNF